MVPYACLIPLPKWMLLPHWVNNPFYGPILVPEDVEEYSEAEDPSDSEPI